MQEEHEEETCRSSMQKKHSEEECRRSNKKDAEISQCCGLPERSLRWDIRNLAQYIAKIPCSDSSTYIDARKGSRTGINAC